MKTENQRLYGHFTIKNHSKNVNRDWPRSDDLDGSGKAGQEQGPLDGKAGWFLSGAEGWSRRGCGGSYNRSVRDIRRQLRLTTGSSRSRGPARAVSARSSSQEFVEPAESHTGTNACGCRAPGAPSQHRTSAAPPRFCHPNPYPSLRQALHPSDSNPESLNRLPHILMRIEGAQSDISLAARAEAAAGCADYPCL